MASLFTICGNVNSGLWWRHRPRGKWNSIIQKLCTQSTARRSLAIKTGQIPTPSFAASRPIVRTGLSLRPIQILSRPVDDPRIDACVGDAEYVGSYSWISADRPTIVIPGSPPIWIGRALPFILCPDPPKHRHAASSYSLLPLMRAVDTIGKEINWPAIDFVTDNTNLRKLLMWIRDRKDSNFRIDMELSGERTVLFNIPVFKAYKGYLGNDTGYGFSFENGTTTPAPGFEGGIDHCRIVKYDFFGLKIVVRSEVDACLFNSEMQLDSLRDPLDARNVDSHTVSSEDIRTIRAGFEVPQQFLIELKATGHSSNIDFKFVSAFPQLYFSQTPLFYIGIHNNGTFFKIQMKDMLDMEVQRRNVETHLRKLGQALEMIQELAIAHGTKAHLSLIYHDGVLSVYERVSRKHCLPTEVLARFHTRR